MSEDSRCNARTVEVEEGATGWCKLTLPLRMTLVLEVVRVYRRGAGEAWYGKYFLQEVVSQKLLQWDANGEFDDDFGVLGWVS